MKNRKIEKQKRKIEKQKNSEMVWFLYIDIWVSGILENQGYWKGN